MPTFARSNPAPSGVPQGTPGGRSAAGRRPGIKVMVGDEVYLWFLVALELGLLAFLRQKFRRHHGG